MPGRKKGLLHSLTGRGADDEIMIGQRYRKQGVAWVIWEVATLFEGTDGMEYVQLMRVDDRNLNVLHVPLVFPVLGMTIVPRG